MTTSLDIDGLVERLDHFQELFRLETLPGYAVDDDGDDYHRYVAGEPEPDWTRKQPWLDRLRADRAAGKTRYRVRLLSATLTDYELYACEWGYALNGDPEIGGEDIRVLRRGEHTIPDVPRASLLSQDFWVVDDREVVTMHYDRDAAFVGATLAPPNQLRDHLATRDQLWAAAEPFAAWWARHRDLHRRAAA